MTTFCYRYNRLFQKLEGEIAAQFMNCAGKFVRVINDSLAPAARMRCRRRRLAAVVPEAAVRRRNASTAGRLFFPLDGLGCRGGGRGVRLESVRIYCVRAARVYWRRRSIERRR